MLKRIRYLALLALLGAPLTAEAQANATCSVSPPALAFGAYDSVNATELRTQGAIVVSCSHGNPQVVISIGAGGSGSIAQRELRRAGGTPAMLYNLYRDAALATVWGEGSASVSVKSKQETIMVFGHVPARQTGLEPGSYTDTLVVTIDY